MIDIRLALYKYRRLAHGLLLDDNLNESLAIRRSLQHFVVGVAIRVCPPGGKLGKIPQSPGFTLGPVTTKTF